MSSCLALSRPIVCLLVFIALLLPPALPGSAVPNLGGTCKITETTDLGATVRLIVQLHLVNAGSSSLTITNVAIPSYHTLPFHSVTVKRTLRIPANSSSDVSIQFQVPKQDYNAWSALPVPAFILTLQMAGKRAGTLNLHIPQIPN